MLAFACTDQRLALTSDRWDTNPWLLGTPEGVLDLRTGTLRDGVPGDYIRTIIPTRWLGREVPAPRFERFLQEIFGDRDEGERAALITFLQRVLGYGITGQGTGNQLAHPSHFIALPEMLLPEVPCLFQVIESTTPLEEVGKQQGISPFVFPVRIEDGVKLDLRIGVW